MLETSFEKQERVTGVIFGKVKGGFTVDLSGATAFLPGSQVDIRAERRTKELIHAGQSVMFREVLTEMQERDNRDRSRTVAPLRPADDAITIDTSKMDADAVLALAQSHIAAVSG